MLTCCFILQVAQIESYTVFLLLQPGSSLAPWLHGKLFPPTRSSLPQFVNGKYPLILLAISCVGICVFWLSSTAAIQWITVFEDISISKYLNSTLLLVEICRLTSNVGSHTTPHHDLILIQLGILNPLRDY